MPGATKAFNEWQVAAVPVLGTGTTALASNTLIVVSLSGVGSIKIGKTVTGPGIPGGTTITAFVTGVGGLGTYTMSAAAGVGFGTGAITLQ